MQRMQLMHLMHLMHRMHRMHRMHLLPLLRHVQPPVSRMNPPHARPVPFRAAALPPVHDAWLAAPGWPAVLPPVQGELMRWVQTNHAFNSRLWAEEDLARRTLVADAEIAANKRAIDRFNQARNDATERIDEILLTALGLVDAASVRSDAPRPTVPAQARLNSETAGSMIDRLSILALKVRAMREQSAESPWHLDNDEAGMMLAAAGAGA